MFQNSGYQQIERRILLVVASMVVFIFAIPSAKAEYPKIESVVAPQISSIVEQLSDKTILVSLDEPKEIEGSWRLGAAIETEIVAQLLEQGISAVDDDTDERFKWLARSKSKSVKRWQENPVFDFLLTGKYQYDRELVLNLSIYSATSDIPIAQVKLKFSQKDADIKSNVPPFNLAVARFVDSNRGKKIGGGICATAAGEALVYAGCKRLGTYDWGRLLGENEALLPGDIMQFEKVFFKGRDHSGLKFEHHTAIISEIVDRNTVKVLHQNVMPLGKRISERTLHLDQKKRGSIFYYRPTDMNTVLPIDLMPLRRSPARVVKNKKGQIDLLRTTKPELDAIHGMWGKWEGPICSHKESYGRLQIPVDLPESYTVRARVKRTFGTDGYIMILVVGGHQCLLGLDNYGGTMSGLEMINGKKLNKNEAMRKVHVFPKGKNVNLVVKVTPNSVHASADGKTIVSWSGDPTVLTLQKKWDVPNKTWLHIGAYKTVFETSVLTLEEISD